MVSKGKGKQEKEIKNDKGKQENQKNKINEIGMMQNNPYEILRRSLETSQSPIEIKIKGILTTVLFVRDLSNE